MSSTVEMHTNALAPHEKNLPARLKEIVFTHTKTEGEAQRERDGKRNVASG